MRPEHEDEVIGFCCYCKEDLFEGQDYVIHNDNKYHVDCYELLKDEFDEDEDNE